MKIKELSEKDIKFLQDIAKTKEPSRCGKDSDTCEICPISSDNIPIDSEVFVKIYNIPQVGTFCSSILEWISGLKISSFLEKHNSGLKDGDN